MNDFPVVYGLSQFVHIVRPFLDGSQIIFKFPNSYGASVVRHRGSYGSEKGLFE